MQIAIVDDDPLIRLGLRAVLSAGHGWQVVAEAGDGATALEVVRRHHPALVLMDIRMPGVDGLEATRTVSSGECLVFPASTRRVVERFAVPGLS